MRDKFNLLSQSARHLPTHNALMNILTNVLEILVNLKIKKCKFWVANNYFL
jgi:hypothetical protein